LYYLRSETSGRNEKSERKWRKKRWVWLRRRKKKKGG
jgi:hypothetical protein